MLPQRAPEALQGVTDARPVLAAGDVDDEPGRLGGLLGGQGEIGATDRDLVGQFVGRKRFSQPSQRRRGGVGLPHLGLGDTEGIKHRRKPGRRGAVADELQPGPNGRRAVPGLPQRFRQEVRRLGRLPLVRHRREILPQRPDRVAIRLHRQRPLGHGKRPPPQFKASRQGRLGIGPPGLPATIDDRSEGFRGLRPLPLLEPTEPEVVAPLRRQRIKRMIAQERAPRLGGQIPRAAVLERGGGGVRRLRRRARAWRLISRAQALPRGKADEQAENEAADRADDQLRHPEPGRTSEVGGRVEHDHTPLWADCG